MWHRMSFSVQLIEQHLSLNWKWHLLCFYSSGKLLQFNLTMTLKWQTWKASLKNTALPPIKYQLILLTRQTGSPAMQWVDFHRTSDSRLSFAYRQQTCNWKSMMAKINHCTLHNLLAYSPWQTHTKSQKYRLAPKGFTGILEMLIIGPFKQTASGIARHIVLTNSGISSQLFFLFKGFSVPHRFNLLYYS